MGLVHGFTDILTPVNLLPNSDFSRGGGIPSSLSYNTIVNSGTTQDYKIAENMFIQSVGQSLSNVSITRNNNDLSLSGKLGSSTGSNSVIRLFNQFTFKANQKYTVSFKLSNANSIVIGHSITLGSSASYLYSVTDVNGKYVAVIQIGDSDVSNLYMSISISGASGNSVAFHISDMLVYEGAFCNPPVTTSLDVKLSNQFALSTEVYEDVDSVPTENSTNPVSSGGVYTALSGKQPSGNYLTPNSTLDASKLSGTVPSSCYTNTTYSNFVGSGSSAAAGLVPAPPSTSGTTKFLREDGQWAVASADITEFTTSEIDALFA